MMETEYNPIEMINQHEAIKKAFEEKDQEIKNLEKGCETQIQELARIKEVYTKIQQLLRHEIKTPLTSIMGYADLLFRGKISPEKAQPIYKRIIDGGKVIDYISGCLSLSSFETKEIKKDPTKLVLENILHTQAIAFEKPLIDNNIGLKIKYDRIEHEPIEIYANESVINFIFATLLGNSTNYAPANSRITEGLWIKDNNLELMVENRSLKEKQRLVHGTNNGLGLPITQEIIHNLSGTFEEYNEQQITNNYDCQEVFGDKKAKSHEGNIYGVKITIPMSEFTK
jgi:signal transduction histidine kinase